MGLIVDAYNVLHCSHVLPSSLAMISATDLCRLIDRSRWGGDRTAVVCDGSPKPDEGSYEGGVRLVYSGPGRDADSVIEQLIAEDTSPRDLLVVSNDRRIHKAARKRRCRTMASERFLRLLVRGPSGSRDEAEAEAKSQAMGGTEAWLREFDLEDHTLESIEAEQRERDETPECRRRGKRCKPPEESDDAKTRREASESESEYWLRTFGYLEEDRG